MKEWYITWLKCAEKIWNIHSSQEKNHESNRKNTDVENSSRIYCFTKIWLCFFQLSRYFFFVFVSFFDSIAHPFLFVSFSHSRALSISFVAVAVDTKLFKWYKYLVWEYIVCESAWCTIFNIDLLVRKTENHLKSYTHSNISSSLW